MAHKETSESGVSRVSRHTVQGMRPVAGKRPRIGAGVDATEAGPSRLHAPGKPHEVEAGPSRSRRHPAHGMRAVAAVRPHAGVSADAIEAGPARIGRFRK